VFWNPEEMHLLIITPTLGRSPYLDETVSCIQRCAFPVQHILSCPQARISELKTRFPQSRVVCDQGKQAGIYGAINAGLAAAQEPWDFFTYLNDDDRFGIHFGAMFKRHATAENLRTVGFGCIWNIDKAGRKVTGMTVGPYPQQYPALLQMGISPTGQQGMVFGREVVKTIGAYSTQYKICGDLDYWCRAMAAGFRFIFYPLDAGRFRLQAGQISGDVCTLRDELQRIARIHFPKEVPVLQKKLAKATYRLYNAPRYFQRIVRLGFKSSYQLLES
jgi:glycosyltransferase involved in cell wall biosynthesis